MHIRIIKQITCSLTFLLITLAVHAQTKPAVGAADRERAKQLNQTGLLHFHASRMKKALEQFEAAAKLDPSEPEYANNAGVCYLQTRRFAKARGYFQRASSARELPLYRFNEGLAGIQLGEYREAISLMERAVALDANYGDAWKHLGIAAFAAGEYAKAEQAWLRASDILRDPEVETNLGTLYLNQKRSKLARARFEGAIQIAPKYYLAYFNLGVLNQSQNRFQQAEAQYRRAAQIAPEAYATYLNLAIVQERLGKTDAAIDSLERFLAIVPPGLIQQKQDARKRLKRLKERAQ